MKVLLEIGCHRKCLRILMLNMLELRTHHHKTRQRQLLTRPRRVGALTKLVQFNTSLTPSTRSVLASRGTHHHLPIMHSNEAENPEKLCHHLAVWMGTRMGDGGDTSTCQERAWINGQATEMPTKRKTNSVVCELNGKGRQSWDGGWRWP